MGRRDSSLINKLSILETIVKESVVKKDHSNDDVDHDNEVNYSTLDLVYRRDGIADLEFVTLIAQNAEIASVSALILSIHTVCIQWHGTIHYTYNMHKHVCLSMLAIIV